MSVQPIPAGFHTLTPYLMVKGAHELIAFLKEAFAAEEISRHEGPHGLILNAELKIGSSMLLVAEARDNYASMPAALYMYLEDTDAAYHRAIQAGATSLVGPSDQFYGDRNAGIQDICGNQWWIATRIEDLSHAEVAKRAESFHSAK